MLAKEIMTTSLVTAGPETPVEEIAQLMMEHRISAVPVVEEDQRLIGIVSETDLLRREHSGSADLPQSWWLRLFNARDRISTTVKETHGHIAKNIMTTPPITVHVEATIEEVASVFLRRKINQEPVVRGGTLVGIVSRGDLVKAIAK